MNRLKGIFSGRYVVCIRNPNNTSRTQREEARASRKRKAAAAHESERNVGKMPRMMTNKPTPGKKPAGL